MDIAPQYVVDLAVLDYPAGRRLLICVDGAGAVHRLDLMTGVPLGPPISLGKWSRIIGARLDAQGRPLVHVLHDDDNPGSGNVECWRLDDGRRDASSAGLPGGVCGVFELDEAPMMLVGSRNGSLTIRPLPA